MFGSRPNRQEIKDLIYGRLHMEINVIKDVQFLGRGYYHIEFANTESVSMVLASNPLDLRGAQALFSPWYHGFNAQEAAKRDDKLFKVIAVFPNLPKEYIPFMSRIGDTIGRTLETEETMAARLVRANGHPSVRILVAGVDALPTVILLPTSGGGKFSQVVEYAGLPNQCFVCRKIGHLAKDCPRRDKKQPQHYERIPQDPPINRESPSEDPHKQHWVQVNRKGKKIATTESTGQGVESGISTSNPFAVLQGREANLPGSTPEAEIINRDTIQNLGPETLLVERATSSDNNNKKLSKVSNKTSHYSFLLDRETSEKGLINGAKEGGNPKKLVLYRGESEQNMLVLGKRSLLQSQCDPSHLPPPSNETTINIKPMTLDSLRPFPSNFDIRETKREIPYSLLRLFGMLEEHEPALFRFHILFQPEAQQIPPDSPLGFSFPLCGLAGEEKDAPIFELIERQAEFFSNFLGSQQLSELLVKGWSTSKVSVIPEPDYEGTRHVILTITNCGLQDQGYLYIHEDRLSEAHVFAKGHYHWRFIRDRMQPSGGFQGEPSSTSPQSEPNLKLRKLAKQAQVFHSFK